MEERQNAFCRASILFSFNRVGFSVMSCENCMRNREIEDGDVEEKKARENFQGEGNRRSDLVKCRGRGRDRFAIGTAFFVMATNSSLTGNPWHV